jgi:hypothetical protein
MNLVGAMLSGCMPVPNDDSPEMAQLGDGDKSQELTEAN